MFALAPLLLLALSIDVPYLTQSEDLCGGAAVAMVQRYWGNAHADPQQFAPLIDHHAHGIPAGVLVNAVARSGWRAVSFPGSVDRLRDDVAQGRPTIVLLQVRAHRYHFVVVTGVGDREVTLHDPAIGPSQRMSIEAFTKAWRPAHDWALLVLPPERTPADIEGAAVPDVHARGEPAGSVGRSTCDQRLEEAIDRVRSDGVGAADRILGQVRRECPASAGPLRELAGVRFAQRRWADAAALAERAVAIDHADPYAWEVLASSRFVQDDVVGALKAWNALGKPRVDSVRIAGLARTRSIVVSEALALRPGALLTADAFRRAAHRLEALPTRTTSRLGYQPKADGYAVVDVAIAERRARPPGLPGWIATTLHAAVAREIGVTLPGTTGQGETWGGAWRWWGGRPRVGLSFAAPRAGRWPGVWRVEGSWEAETYSLGDAGTNSSSPHVRDERAHGAVSVSDWLTGNLRYACSLGVDAWSDGAVRSGDRRRTVSGGGLLEQRLFADRVALIVSATRAVALTGPAFATASVGATYVPRDVANGGAWAAEGGVWTAARGAPRMLWAGAGEGLVRAPLLRAHPLLHDGAIDRAVFGRRVISMTVERRQWIPVRVPAALGVAIFADTARAFRPLNASMPAGWQLDLGAGLRVKVPGAAGVLRLDAARGVRDGTHALTVGWAR